MSVQCSLDFRHLPLVELKLVKSSAETDSSPMRQINRGEFASMNTEDKNINFIKFMWNCINAIRIFPLNFRFRFQPNFFFLSISLRFWFVDEFFFMICSLFIKIDQFQFESRLLLGLRHQISMHLFERSVGIGAVRMYDN
jgi:hypothetical protein